MTSDSHNAGISAISVCIYEDLRLLIVCFRLAGEPAEKDLPVGGATPQWDAAEGWAGAEMQVWNRTLIHMKR